MGATRYPSTHAATWRAPDTSEMHNASVNEDAARQGVCAQVHLPTGRMCTLPHGHRASCHFVQAENACAAPSHHRSDLTDD